MENNNSKPEEATISPTASESPLELARIKYGLSAEQIQVLRYQLCKDHTQAELCLFLKAAYETYKLDPFRRQIYSIKRGGVAQIQAGIDGLRAIAARNPNYAGNTQENLPDDADGKPVVRATVYKMVQGVRCAYDSIAKFSEFYKDGKVSALALKMPTVMTAKCAESAALRKAFPEDLGGLYSTEEMEQSK